MAKVEVEAGRLRHRIKIQSATPGLPNSFGTPSQTFLPQWERYASIDPISGREAWFGQQVSPDVTHGITIRYTAGITPKMRVVFQGRIFEIQSVLDIEERKRKMALQCVEQVA